MYKILKELIKTLYFKKQCLYEPGLGWVPIISLTLYVTLQLNPFTLGWDIDLDYE